MGPSTSQSTNIRMVNGSFTKTSNYTYSYIFLAEKEGKFTIPAVSMEFEGKIYKTKPQLIEVLKGNVPQNQQNARQNTPQRTQNIGTPQPSQNAKQNFFVRVLLNKNTAYPNEAIVATLKLYTRYAGISDVALNAPSFKGFLSKEIPNSGSSRFTQENINGAIYNTAVINKYVLFPQRSGKLVIDDFSIDAVAQNGAGRAQSIFDEVFGNSMVQRFRVSAKCPPKTVNVLPLPANKPSSFTNAVGNFSISSNLSTDSIAVNEAVTLKIKVRGKGNLQMLKAPKLQLSPDLEVYDPKINNKTGITAGGMNGSISYEYLIIPRQPGVFEIPAVAFSYFNPVTKKYEQKSTSSYTLKVKGQKGTALSADSSIARFQHNRQDVTNLGNDIKYIKTDSPNFQKKNAYFWNSLLFWVLFLGLPLLALLYYFLIRNKESRSADTMGNKSKRANKVAIKRLKIAKKSLENNEKEAFYNHVLDALWGFVSDKLHLPTSQLNKDNVEQLLHEKGVAAEDIASYMETLNDCEMAQYAPVDSVDMQGSYQKAISIISKLEQNL